MDADCIEHLRLQADAVEESGRLLLADCARVLHKVKEASDDED